MKPNSVRLASNIRTPEVFVHAVHHRQHERPGAALGAIADVLTEQVVGHQIHWTGGLLTCPARTHTLPAAVLSACGPREPMERWGRPSGSRTRRRSEGISRCRW